MERIELLIPAIFTTLLLSANCCKNKDNCHDTIFIKNSSDKAIYFDKSYRYPDTIPHNDGVVSEPSIYRVEKSSEKQSITRGCYEGKMNSSYPKIMFFIYDAQILENTPWDTIAKKNMVLKRYDLSLEDLQRMNWTITYP